MSYPYPKDEEAFEEFCLALLKHHWKCDTLERYAHRGENQDGVDILDLGAHDPLRAAQCKLHAADKTLPPSELEAEVDKAKGFTPCLGHYLVLTTAKKSKETQKSLLKINRDHKAAGLFDVALLTWEGIERLLDNYPDVRGYLGDVAPHFLQRELASISRKQDDIIKVIQPLSASSLADGQDAEIDEAKALLLDHSKSKPANLQLARLLLNRIRNRRWDSLTGRQRYRVLVNLAATLMAEGEFPKAGQLLIEAATHQKDDPQAQAVEAKGYELVGNLSIAYERASLVLSKTPTSQIAAAVRIRSAPDTIGLDALTRELDPAAMNAEVAAALAIRATKAADFAKAEEFAIRATRESPEWAPGWLVLGQSIFAGQIEDLRRGRRSAQKPNPEALRKAEECLSKAIDLAKAEGENHPSLIDALQTRAKTKALLAVGGGDEDIEEAHRLAPRDPEILRDYAVLLIDRGKIEEARNLARQAVELGNAPLARFLLANLLWKDGNPTSRKEATTIYSTIALEPGLPFHAEAASHAMRGFCDAADWKGAESFAADMANTGDTVMSSVVSGMLARSRGDLAAARNHAHKANLALSEDSPASVIRCTANLFAALGLYGDALPLLQSISFPLRDPSDTANLLVCAQHLERFDVALETYRALREHGASTPEMIAQEAALLDRFDPPRAVELLQQHLATTPRDLVSRLRLSVIGLRLGRPELVSSNESDLPTVEEIAPDLIWFVVQVLREAGKPDAALAYAYRALRRHFKEHEAHRTYLSLLAPDGRLDVFPTQHKVAEASTAVCFVEDNSEEKKWLVIEDDTPCYPELHEQPLEHQLVRRFLGKQVGDTVALTDSSIQPRQARVIEIVDKYAYRYQDVMEEWELRFGEHFVEGQASGLSFDGRVRRLLTRSQGTD
jgi:tetratricopeptide (TPR) repeat protein